MKLYLIRHAQSVNNAAGGPHELECDPPLTETGHRQAELVAEYLAQAEPPENRLQGPNGHGPRGLGLTTLYCSAMRRSLETARPIAGALGLRPEVWTDLHERGGLCYPAGDGRLLRCPGLTRAEFEREFPGYRLPDTITAEGWWTGDQEPRDACTARAARVAAELRRRANSDERIGLISHGDFLDMLLKSLFGLGDRQDLYYLHYNTAITHLDSDASGKLSVWYANRTAHLPPELVT